MTTPSIAHSDGEREEFRFQERAQLSINQTLESVRVSDVREGHPTYSAALVILNRYHFN